MDLSNKIIITDEVSAESLDIAEEVYFEFSKKLLAELYRTHAGFIAEYDHESTTKHRIAMNYFNYFKAVLSKDPGLGL
uniref:Uncharacterized protein n=1 Tax=Curvibacter symbiont subsp. Hydra magnipapillata TaxID=667019 RepID=C9Y6T7_CURXX|nr:hypothetical protein Csp_E36640 [Curvibacter putative symbiont of Hydra magnipapillata]